jgi:hypothetical protein
MRTALARRWLSDLRRHISDRSLDCPVRRMYTCFGQNQDTTRVGDISSAWILAWQMPEAGRPMTVFALTA